MLRTLLLFCLACVPAIADADETGRQVFVKYGEVGRIGDNNEIHSGRIPFPAKVDEVNGDAVRLGTVWVEKKNVMNAQEAMDYYSAKIKELPDTWRLYKNRGILWELRGDLENAHKDYTEGRRLEARTRNDLAWMNATSPNQPWRSGKQSVENATIACELTEWKNAKYIGTLAAGYAELGDFEIAQKWSQKAIDLATMEEEKTKERQRSELYKKGKPFRQ